MVPGGERRCRPALRAGWWHWHGAGVWARVLCRGCPWCCGLRLGGSAGSRLDTTLNQEGEWHSGWCCGDWEFADRTREYRAMPRCRGWLYQLNAMQMHGHKLRQPSVMLTGWKG